MRGLVGSAPMKIQGAGYGGRVVPDAAAANAYALADLEAATGLVFDALLVDCEGCSAPASLFFSFSPSNPGRARA